VGYDHKFGKGRDGDENLLRSLGKDFGFTVSTVGPVTIDNKIISSTLIRNLLKDGEVEEANKMLGYNYSLRGKVVKGDQRGRTIGFPTANLGEIHPDKLIPKNGVYAVKVNVENETFGGMMNIGYRPTFKSENELIMEVFIFDFDKNIYNIEIEIEFLNYLRKEIKFSSVDELVEQLNKDKERTKKILNN
ncbi:MAG: riboflavin biosynthesis protein RibF, partial [Ignavibacteria bacterium]